MKLNLTPVGWAIISIFVVFGLHGCLTTSPEDRIARDLIGHTTGGRESSWKFETGQVKKLRIIEEKDNQKIISVRTDAGQGVYLQILKLTYEGEILRTVGQLYIQKEQR